MLYSRNISTYERGLRFDNGEFVGILGPGRHTYWASIRGHRVDVVSVLGTWLHHPLLDVISRRGDLLKDLMIIDVNDNQRALVWIDNRFATILGPGRHAAWTVLHDVRVELVELDPVRFEHEQLAVILRNATSAQFLKEFEVAAGHMALMYVNGSLRESLNAGRYAYWRHLTNVVVKMIDRRESVLDIPGQEIMTLDKVSIRLNAQISYRLRDPVRAIESVVDATQALYRSAQLALRAVIGTRDLDALLADKETSTKELAFIVRRDASAYGIDVLAFGIRDLILPGDMKELLNKVTEARKAAEANLITRREEVAGIRSQANAAKLLENNPTLMRLRELETLEKVASHSNLNVSVGKEGLADQIVNLL